MQKYKKKNIYIVSEKPNDFILLNLIQLHGGNNYAAKALLPLILFFVNVIRSSCLLVCKYLRMYTVLAATKNSQQVDGWTCRCILEIGLLKAIYYCIN